MLRYEGWNANISTHCTSKHVLYEYENTIDILFMQLSHYFEESCWRSNSIRRMPSSDSRVNTTLCQAGTVGEVCDVKDLLLSAIAI